MPLATSMRAMLQLVPKELATPTSHFPSGDQVNCWKNPLRGSVRKTCRVAKSMNATPFMDKLASWSPSD